MSTLEDHFIHIGYKIPGYIYQCTVCGAFIGEDWRRAHKSWHESLEPIPNPGSSEAISKGCTCPGIQDYDGMPYPNGTRWFINLNCELHREMA